MLVVVVFVVRGRLDEVLPNVGSIFVIQRQDVVLDVGDARGPVPPSKASEAAVLLSLVLGS